MYTLVNKNYCPTNNSLVYIILKFPGVCLFTTFDLYYGFPKNYLLGNNFYHKTKGVFILRRASPIGRASPLCRDPASQLNPLSKFVFVYMRGGPALLGRISLLTTEISPRRAGNFPYNRT